MLNNQNDDYITKKYTFKQVICPDEKAGIQDDNPFTNAIASETMKFAIFIANKFKLNANPKWKLYSENILILIFVGGIEYYFFMNIASKYVPIK